MLPRTARHASGLLLAITPLITGACQANRFTKTDSAFQEQRSASPPALFIEQPPTRAFHQVGYFRVVAAEDQAESVVAQSLVGVAQDAGCDVLVSKRFVSRRVTPWPFRLQLAQHEGHDPSAHEREPRETPDRPVREESAPRAETRDRNDSPGIERSRPSVRTFEFVCGVYQSANAQT